MCADKKRRRAALGTIINRSKRKQTTRLTHTSASARKASQLRTIIIVTQGQRTTDPRCLPSEKGQHPVNYMFNAMGTPQIRSNNG